LLPHPPILSALHADRIERLQPAGVRASAFTTFFDPEFEEIGGAAMGVAEWRNREIE